MSAETTAVYASLQSNEEKLVNDLTRIVSDAEGLLKEFAGTSADESATTREKFVTKLCEARARVDEARIDLARKTRHAADAANDYIRENPWKVAAFVSLAGLGMLAAALLKRRSMGTGG